MERGFINLCLIKITKDEDYDDCDVSAIVVSEYLFNCENNLMAYHPEEPKMNL